MAGYVIDWGVVASILVAVAALITALASKYKAKKQGEVTAVTITERVIKLTNDKLTDMAKQLEDMENEVYGCRGELDDLRREVATLRKGKELLADGVNRLCYQLKSMGQTPVWDPKLLDCAFADDVKK